MASDSNHIQIVSELDLEATDADDYISMAGSMFVTGSVDMAITPHSVQALAYGLDKPGFIARICKVDPTSRWGKKIQMVQMLTLMLIPIVALAVMTSLNLNNTAVQHEQSKVDYLAVKFSLETGNVIHRLQRERDMTALHLSSLGAQTRVFLTERYPATDLVIRSLSQWPSSTRTGLGAFVSKESFLRYLQLHRKSIDKSVTNVYKEIEFYSETIQLFTDWLYSSIQSSRDGSLWRSLVAYQLLVLSKEQLGIERTLGNVFFSSGGFEKQEHYVSFLKNHVVGIKNFEASQKFSPLVKNVFETTRKDIKNVSVHVNQMREFVTWQLKTEVGRAWQAGAWWFDNMTVLVDAMFEVQVHLAAEILAALDEFLYRDTTAIIVSISVLSVVLVISPTIILFTRIIITDIQKYALQLADRTLELSNERKRTEILLYQMIPQAIAEQLKRNEQVTAETFDAATVFFSDIVGFTNILSDCSPMQIVAVLNSLYTCFDARLELYDVYKVETISDTYMVSSGVPKRNGNRHITEISKMALDIMHHVGHLEIPHLPGRQIQLRAGINSGSVVAGVVGLKMPRYCLFGDTVNTASRMESYGFPDRIHLSSASAALLQSTNAKFQVVRRGVMDIKGKGLMETYWLVGRPDFEKTWPCMPGCPMEKRAVYLDSEMEDNLAPDKIDVEPHGKRRDDYLGTLY